MPRPKCDDVTDVVFVFLAFLLKLETRCDGLRVTLSYFHWLWVCSVGYTVNSVVFIQGYIGACA